MVFRAVVVFRRCRRDTELLREIAALLPHDSMIARQHGAKLAHGGGTAFFRAELAGLDVGRVGGIEDGDDRRIVQRTARGWGGRAGSEHEGDGAGCQHRRDGECTRPRHVELLLVKVIAMGTQRASNRIYGRRFSRPPALPFAWRIVLPAMRRVLCVTLLAGACTRPVLYYPTPESAGIKPSPASQPADAPSSAATATPAGVPVPADPA